MANSSVAIHSPDNDARPDNILFIQQLKSIVGSRYVLTESSRTLRFRKGFRCGLGPALAVVQPGSLVEQWRLLKACIAANKIIIMQAANTGLTGGSTPEGSDYDRDIVIVSTLRIDKIQLINNGLQAICYAGSTLFQLESTASIQVLAAPLSACAGKRMGSVKECTRTFAPAASARKVS